MRLTVSAIAIYLAHRSLTENSTIWVWTFGAITVLFNPVVPIRMHRAGWSTVDLIAAAIFALWAIISITRSTARWIWKVNYLKAVGASIALGTMKRKRLRNMASFATFQNPACTSASALLFGAMVLDCVLACDVFRGEIPRPRVARRSLDSSVSRMGARSRFCDSSGSQRISNIPVTGRRWIHAGVRRVLDSVCVLSARVCPSPQPTHWRARSPDPHSGFGGFLPRSFIAEGRRFSRPTLISAPSSFSVALARHYGFG